MGHCQKLYEITGGYIKDSKLTLAMENNHEAHSLCMDIYIYMYIIYIYVRIHNMIYHDISLSLSICMFVCM